MATNVGVNRIRANCSGFVGLRTIPQMIYLPKVFEAELMDIFIKGHEKAKEGWQDDQYKEKSFGLPNTAFGISGRQEIVLLHGMISRWSADLNFIQLKSPHFCKW